MVSLKSAFVLSAVSSGSGKTTVCNGLLRALARRGVRCAPFKTGPDYIDPYFHKKACGNDSINLDIFMSDKKHVAKLFKEYAVEAEVGVVEGVMGLFDGYDCKEGSAADIASTLGLPAILVIDAHSSAYSLAAVLYGLRTFDPSVDVRGVVFNNVASENHLELLKKAAIDGGVEYLGHIRHNASLSTPSRYLGLVMDGDDDIERYILNAADAVEDGVDLDKLISLTAYSGFDIGSLPMEEDAIPKNILSGKRIAVAHDEAFNFIYPENLKSLRRLSGRADAIVEFSPLNDLAIPEADMVYFPGGYPEIYADRLSRNYEMIESVRKFSEKGGMIYGECGGFLYLCNSIDEFGMCGLLPFHATMATPRLSLGYRKVTICGMEFRGHEFHYSRVDNLDKLDSIAVQTDVRGNKVPTGLYRKRNTVAGYTHLYWGQAETAGRLMNILFEKVRFV